MTLMFIKDAQTGQEYLPIIRDGKIIAARKAGSDEYLFGLENLQEWESDDSEPEEI